MKFNQELKNRFDADVTNGLLIGDIGLCDSCYGPSGRIEKIVYAHSGAFSECEQCLTHTSSPQEKEARLRDLMMSHEPRPIMLKRHHLATGEPALTQILLTNDQLDKIGKAIDQVTHVGQPKARYVVSSFLAIITSDFVLIPKDYSGI